jgi:AcrR family transcriptional regulator
MPATMKKPKAEPRKRRGERTREAILEAARALLLEKGLEKLSLREIARRADYSAPALYEYFANKSALVRALAEKVSGGLSARLGQAAAQGRAGPNGPLVEMGLAYIAHALENTEEFLLLGSRRAGSVGGDGGPISADSPYRAMFEVVAREVVGGALCSRAGQADQIAYGLWALAHGLAMLQLTSLSNVDADFAGADRRILEAFVDGLCDNSPEGF